LSLVRFLGRHCLAILFVSAFMGLAAPSMAEVFRPFTPFGVFGIVLGAVLRVEPPELYAELLRPQAAASLVLWSTVILPLATLLAPTWLLPAHLAGPLAVILAAPTGSTNAPVAAALGGNVVIAVLAAVATMALAPITMPLIIEQVGGTIAPNFDALGASARLLLLTAGSAVLAFVVRRMGHNPRSSGLADACTASGLLIFGIGAMAGISDVIAADLDGAMHGVMVAFAAYAVTCCLGLLAFLRRDWPTALTAGLASASRNMGFVWAAVGTAAGPKTYLFFACYMLPVHTMPFAFKTVASFPERRSRLSSIET
jgi:BASS family bile acid:Na+ symporter